LEHVAKLFAGLPVELAAQLVYLRPPLVAVLDLPQGAELLPHLRPKLFGDLLDLGLLLFAEAQLLLHLLHSEQAEETAATWAPPEPPSGAFGGLGRSGEGGSQDQRHRQHHQTSNSGHLILPFLNGAKSRSGTPSHDSQ